MSSPESQPPLLDVFSIDRPEQLKALGHPLRLRVLEMLGQSEEGSLTNRELAQRLAPLRPSMKVLYTSGYTDSQIDHHGVLEPGIAFLQKPFTSDDLTRKVRSVLDEAALAVD